MKTPVLERVWSLKLQRALEHPYLHLKGQRVFCAFNAITDAVVKFDRREYESILKAAHLPSIRRRIQDFSLISIQSREDFIAAFLKVFSSGKALELPSHDAKLFEWFRLHFRERFRMGGQAGIIANQLSQLQVDAVCYSPILSKAQSRLYNRQHLFFPAVQHGRLVFKKPSAAFRDSDPTKVNWIFEFKKGDRLRVGKNEITCPRSNRLIVASRPPEYVPLFSPDMHPYLHQISNSFDVFFLAGFQSFQRKMNGADFRAHLRRLQWQLGQLQVNKSARFHIEYVAIHDPKLEKAIYPSLLKKFDSFGINEVETVHFLKRLGDYPLAEALEAHESPLNYYHAIRRIFHKFNLKRLHAHTLGYFLLLLRKDYAGRIHPREFADSLLFASRVADARAALGKPPAFADLKKLHRLKMSGLGISAIRSMAHALLPEEKKAGQFILSGIHDAGDHYLIMVPTAIVKPRATVGLGDTISSVAFASEPF